MEQGHSFLWKAHAQNKTFFMEEVMNTLSSFLKDDILACVIQYAR